MAQHWKPAPAVKPMSEQFPKPKPTQQYEKPIGPEKPVKETKKEKVHKALQKAGNFIAPKIKRVAENAQRSSRRGSGAGGFHISPPADMFTFAPPAFMMGMPGSQAEPAPRPRKRRKSRKRAAPRQQSQGPSWQDIGGIPPEVKRWMM